MDIKVIAGLRIKHLREQRNETQEYIARLLKVGKPTVSRYESGEREPDYKRTAILARHFNVSVDYLLGLTDVPDPAPPPSSATLITSNEVFVLESIDLIRGSMTYENLSSDISEKMANPLYKDILTADYLRNLASGKIHAADEIIEMLADYAKVDLSFFYASSTVLVSESLGEYRIGVEVSGEKSSAFDDELKAFIFTADSIAYLKFAMFLKGFNVVPEKLARLKEVFFKSSDDWKYVEFIRKIKRKGINPDDIAWFSPKSRK